MKHKCQNQTLKVNEQLFFGWASIWDRHKVATTVSKQIAIKYLVGNPMQSVYLQPATLKPPTPVMATSRNITVTLTPRRSPHHTTKWIGITTTTIKTTTNTATPTTTNDNNDKNNSNNDGNANDNDKQKQKNDYDRCYWVGRSLSTTISRYYSYYCGYYYCYCYCYAYCYNCYNNNNNNNNYYYYYYY